MKVDYNLENMLKCICCKCEVQTRSKCANDRTNKIQKIEAKGLEAIPVFRPKEFPWLYCSTGKADCHDLNFKKVCKCKECKVWKENHLEHGDLQEYYCRDKKNNI
jgi:hypothetical protein